MAYRRNNKKYIGYFPYGILAFLFSAFIVIGFRLDLQVRKPLSVTFLIIFFLTIPLFLIMCKADLFISCLKDGNNRHNSRLKNNDIIRYGFVTIVIIWLAGYLALFPGVYGIDAPTWFFMYSRKDIFISSQWSVFCTAFFYFFVKLGNTLFHSYVAGFAIYSFMQMLFTLYAVWRILKFLSLHISALYLIASIAFFSLIPAHVILSVTSAQDGPFAACFAICLIELSELALNDDSTLYKKKMISTAAWFFFLCVIRNNGVYAIAVCCLLTLLTAKGQRKRILIPLVIAVACSILYHGPVYSMLNIQKGTGVREMLSLPFQQMAAAYNSDALTITEKNEMHMYLADEEWKMYMPCISDQIKNRVDPSIIKEDPGKFINLYLDAATSAPKEYLKALCYQTLGLWFPFKQYTDARIWHPFLNYVQTDATLNWGPDALKIDRISILPHYEKFLGILYGYGSDMTGYGGNLKAYFTKIPVWGCLNTCGLYFCMVLFSIVYLIRHKKYTAMIPMGMVIGITVTVFLGPVILYRYYAPVIFSAPLWVSSLLWKDAGKI
ncbi:MAG: DUF6020 family protein [Eubacterium sp.]|nr:DUF6020 family protein [Eubacterium sp.]